MFKRSNTSQTPPWEFAAFFVVVVVTAVIGSYVLAEVFGIGTFMPTRPASVSRQTSSPLSGTHELTTRLPSGTLGQVSPPTTTTPTDEPTATMTPAVTLTELQAQQLALITTMAPDYTWPQDVCSQDGNVGCDKQGHIFVLSMSGLGIKAIPAEIGRLTYLRVMDLSVNNLRSLPPEIGQLAKLEQLTLNNNLLTSLPPEIGKLSELIDLNVNMNRIATLPPEIGQLHSLTKLDLSFNQLTSLPPEISHLPNLRTLYLYNNELTSLPPEVCAKFGSIIGPSELCP